MLFDAPPLLPGQRCPEGGHVLGLADTEQVQESVGERVPQAGTVAVLEEVVCVFAILKRFSEGTPHADEALRVPVAAAVGRDCQGRG